MLYKFCLMGDVMLGENHYHFGRGIKTKYHKDYLKLINDNIRKLLFTNVDFTICNFECSLVENSFDEPNLKQSIYRAAENSLSIFPCTSTNIVNIANNHFSQHGKKSARFSKETLTKKGFIIIGEDNNPKTILKNKTIINIWGVSLIKDKNYCQEYFISDFDKLLIDLNLPQKRSNEIWIISIHWGDEYITTPSKDQIVLAHLLAASGFDIIAGHHPHVIQPIEQYNNSIIFYSLGNFIFDQNFSFRTKKGMVSLINVNNKTTLEKTFITYQKKFRVEKSKLFPKQNFSGYGNSFYKLKLQFVGYLMRILMKVELFFHLFKVQKSTLNYLFQSALNK